MRIRMTRGLLAGVGLGLALGCGGDDSTDPQFTGTSARIVVKDTTLLAGESATFLAEVQYIFGPGAPANIFWTLTDTSVASLDIISDGSAFLTAKKAGTTKLAAFINKKFSDTSSLTVVSLGAVKWRQDLGAAALGAAALDDSDHVFVTNQSGALQSFTPGGSLRWSVAACANAFSPSVRVDNGAILTSGDGCTKRLTSSGTPAWTGPVGGAYTGVALTADDGVVALGALGAPLVTVASKFNALGVELWRDTLSTAGLGQTQTPAVGVDGSAYVAWKVSPAGAPDTIHLARIAATGVPKWTVTLPAEPHYTGIALDSAHVYVSYGGGISALDTTGAVLWTQTLTGELSSPVVDAAGNVYVQGVALKSFTSAGTLRWTADTLGMVGPPVGAPSALANGTIVVPCLGEVCEVNASTGALVFRTSLGGGVTEAIAVGSDGTFYVVRQPASGNGELLALWSHTLPVLAGWPTEGHDMQRSRRQD